MVPVQDVLGLGSEGRMNRPGEPFGNWSWRLERGSLTAELARRLRKVTEAADEFRAAAREPQAAATRLGTCASRIRAADSRLALGLSRRLLATARRPACS